ncbi:MAG TPA: cyclomaltodextrinase C-terminal domain-containing protein, partial [Ferruginibacter sp.]|nr:cyclomaltodextrinase C-terminal domain-containing protein [Ferruginibacter sp.]
LTSRGVPEIYYGDELATPGITSPNDGYVRLDFPGGWPGDKADKFSIAGRTKKDQEIFQYFATLANFRKSSSALTTGKFMQYVPEDGVYVYFRYDNIQTIMVVMNTSKQDKKIDPSKFSERTNGFNNAKDVIGGKVARLSDVSVGAGVTGVYELQR